MWNPFSSLSRNASHHSTDQRDQALSALDTDIPPQDLTAPEKEAAAALDDAADAADAGLNADHAAAYGWLHSGYDEALADQAAARDVLPDLSSAVTERVEALQERQGRPITLPEVRWLQRSVNENQQQHEHNTTLNTPDADRAVELAVELSLEETAERSAEVSVDTTPHWLRDDRPDLHDSAWADGP
jgi:hypothetical protein